jgi:large subunit ribosomal protein L30
MSKRLQVTQRRSTFGQPEPQRKVLAGLGLRGIHRSVVVDNTPSFRGMIKKVIHLVDVTEVDAKDLGK